jgi:hypothetical protein
VLKGVKGTVSRDFLFQDFFYESSSPKPCGTSGKFATSVNDTGGKFAAGVNYT